MLRPACSGFNPARRQPSAIQCVYSDVEDDGPDAFGQLSLIDQSWPCMRAAPILLVIEACSSCPAGDTQALPGYVSFHLQLQDPNLISNHRWDCFASYTLAVLNPADRGADLSRESWHRFSSRPSRQQTRPLSSSSHGWADFTSAAQVDIDYLQSWR